jgi:hypothetical protein
MGDVELDPRAPRRGRDLGGVSRWEQVQRDGEGGGEGGHVVLV